jgi:4'-phosphopantetheinyl transferase
MSQAESKCFPTLEGGPVLVMAHFDALAEHQRAEYQSWLDADENARYGRLAKPLVADCFLAGRAIVKQFIAEIRGSTPAKIKLAVPPSGKPQLAVSLPFSHSVASAVHFSITHKFSLLAVVFSMVSVGVDLEPVMSVDKINIARRFFTSKEADYLQALDDVARKDYFTRLWVLKEAEVKRQGSALAKLLGQVAFCVDDNRIQCHGNSGDGHYQLYQLRDRGVKHYLAIASSAGHSEMRHSLWGLPLAKFEKQEMSLVASC